MQTELIDAKRIAIAGHSRGGSDAAMLLASTRLFSTGIAIAGGMNHALFPHYLQYESDNYWSHPAPYTRNSPAFHADTIVAPLLMIHGEKDMTQARAATSEGLFLGIDAVGGNARLVDNNLDRHI